MRGFLDVRRLCHNIHIVNFCISFGWFQPDMLDKIFTALCLEKLSRHPHTHTQMVDLALIPPGEEASGGGDHQDTKGENHITPYTYLYMLSGSYILTFNLYTFN